MNVAAVVIGRNEGARLVACLEALQGQVSTIIYVDSGSTDGSVEAATQAGAQVIALDLNLPFTAARARNVGLAAVPEGTKYVQFLDGDCQLRENWLSAAVTFLEGHPKAAVVCGRRRERLPDASVYNTLIDAEWDTPIGLTKACGGDALMRVTALQGVEGYRDTLIAGEEPELCVRLRAQGWEVWRLDAEMTWHDADITSIQQWWQRSKRAGHAFAEGAALHGHAPEFHWVTETRRAVLWGGVLPIVIMLAGLLISPLCLLAVLVYPLQVIRLARGTSLPWAFFTTLGKFPEALGVFKYHLAHRFGGKTQIIEYK